MRLVAARNRSQLLTALTIKLFITVFVIKAIASAELMVSKRVVMKWFREALDQGKFSSKY